MAYYICCIFFGRFFRDVGNYVDEFMRARKRLIDHNFCKMSRTVLYYTNDRLRRTKRFSTTQ